MGLEQITMLCRRPSFLRKNVTPVQTGAGTKEVGHYRFRLQLDI